VELVMYLSVRWTMRRSNRCVEGRSVEYDFGDLDELALAFVLPIHKSQDSEFPFMYDLIAHPALPDAATEPALHRGDLKEGVEHGCVPRRYRTAAHGLEEAGGFATSAEPRSAIDRHGFFADPGPQSDDVDTERPLWQQRCQWRRKGVPLSRAR
jgi:hypothetical protein